MSKRDSLDQLLDVLEPALDLLTYYGTIEPYRARLGERDVFVHHLASDRLVVESAGAKPLFEVELRRTATRPL